MYVAAANTFLSTLMQYVCTLFYFNEYLPTNLNSMHFYRNYLWLASESILPQY